MKAYLVAALTAGLAMAAPVFVHANEPAEATAAEDQQTAAGTKPDYTQDPLQLVISLSDQRLRAYRGREIVAESRVSSGKRGYSTPTGIFTIIHKKKFHRSNIYSGAPMPFMQRLTWDGIALHGSGSVPSYPASHGCIRLPQGFDSQLYSMTRSGNHVLVTKDFLEPKPIVHTALPQPASFELASGDYDTGKDQWLAAYQASGEVETGSFGPIRGTISATAIKTTPIERDENEPVQILISRRSQGEIMADVQTVLNRLGYEAGDVDGLFGPATRTAVKRFQEDNELQVDGALTREFISALYEIAGMEQPQDAKLSIRYKSEQVLATGIVIDEPEKPLGTHLLLTSQYDTESSATAWLGYTLNNRIGPNNRLVYGIDADAPDQVTIAQALDRIRIPAHVSRLISRLLTPGSSLMIADNGTNRYTGWKTDFSVLTQDVAPSQNAEASGGKKSDG